MPGKSLDNLIHKKSSKSLETNDLHVNLSFKRKVELLLDVVKGMLYLHGLQPPVVHRDLKPNVSVLKRSTNNV